ncbi:hypothetical protein GCM10027174_37040 [Salinifilum aidingensis]
MADADHGPARSGPPRTVRVAVVLWWIIALLLLAQLAVMWAGHDQLGRTLVDQGAVAPQEAGSRAARLLWVNTGFAAVLAVAYLVLGSLMYGRRPWARLVLTVFAIVHLVMVLGTGAVFGPQIVLVLLGVPATVLLWGPSGAAWVTGEHD